MNLRKQIKRWVYGSCPGMAGRFPFFGIQVYFPGGSQAFPAACKQGSFADLSRAIPLSRGVPRIADVV
jgi:hypothetical protein